jgi:hypothetical protein
MSIRALKSVKGVCITCDECGARAWYTKDSVKRKRSGYRHLEGALFLDRWRAYSEYRYRRLMKRHVCSVCQGNKKPPGNN